MNNFHCPRGSAPSALSSFGRFNMFFQLKMLASPGRIQSNGVDVDIVVSGINIEIPEEQPRVLWAEVLSQSLRRAI